MAVPSALNRAVALSAVAVLACAAAAGCGTRQQPGSEKAKNDSPAPGLTAGELRAQGSGTVVFRVVTYDGEDGEDRRPAFVSYVPRTGATKVVDLKGQRSHEADGAAATLLIDAGRAWALGDSRPTSGERVAGRVTVHSLKTGTSRTLDIRRITGDKRLRTDWVAFDPKQPGQLRVVSGLDVWLVGVDSGSKRKEGTLPKRPGWTYAGGFDYNGGAAYIEDTDSFQTFPKGNGDSATAPVLREGQRLLMGDEGLHDDLPNPGCDVVTGYVTTKKVTWGFCFEGGAITTKVLGDGAKKWADYGKKSTAKVPAYAEPEFALPPG